MVVLRNFAYRVPRVHSLGSSVITEHPSAAVAL